MGFMDETIQAVQPKTKPFWDLRMLERSSLAHAKTFHHGPRPAIANCREGDNFFQPEQMKANAKSFPCSLGCKPFAPVLKRKAPINLNAGGERQFSRRNMQADKADELARGLTLGSPETPTPFFDEQLATAGHCVTFSAGERGREKLHYPWVRVQRGKRLAVSEFPLA